jgi:hypothetical protein
LKCNQEEATFSKLLVCLGKQSAKAFVSEVEAHVHRNIYAQDHIEELALAERTIVSNKVFSSEAQMGVEMVFDEL